MAYIHIAAELRWLLSMMDTGSRSGMYIHSIRCFSPYHGPQTTLWWIRLTLLGSDNQRNRSRLCDWTACHWNQQSCFYACRFECSMKTKYHAMVARHDSDSARSTGWPAVNSVELRSVQFRHIGLPSSIHRPCDLTLWSAGTIDDTTI